MCVCFFFALHPCVCACVSECASRSPHELFIRSSGSNPRLCVAVVPVRLQGSGLLHRLAAVTLTHLCNSSFNITHSGSWCPNTDPSSLWFPLILSYLCLFAVWMELKDIINPPMLSDDFQCLPHSAWSWQWPHCAKISSWYSNNVIPSAKSHNIWINVQ